MVLNNVDNIMIGSSQVEAIYMGANLVWAGEGDAVDSLDPFNDGSLIETFMFDDDARGLKGTVGTPTGVTFKDARWARGATFPLGSSEVSTPSISGIACYSFFTNAPLATTRRGIVNNELSNRNGLSFGVFGVSPSDATITWGDKTSGGTYGVWSINTAINNTDPKHIVIQYMGGTTCECYIDGMSQKVTYAGTLGFNDSFSTIGCLYNTTYRFGVYYIDQLQLFNRALTRYEIEALTIQSTKNLGRLLTATHSGYTSSTGTISASTEYSSTYAAWKASNGSNATKEKSWVTANGVTTGWWQYKFVNPAMVKSFSFVARNLNHTVTPRDFTLQVSDDGTSWTTVMTIVNAPATPYDERSEVWQIPSPIEAKYFRMNATASHGTSFMGIGLIELWS